VVAGSGFGQWPEEAGDRVEPAVVGELRDVDAGSVTVAGIDVARLADDGRLDAITGFFGPLPEA